HPVDGLGGPGAYAIREVEKRLLAAARGQRRAAELDRAAIGGEQAGEAFKECGLACAVGADQAEDFALVDGEAGVLQHGAGSVAFGHALGFAEHGLMGGRLETRDAALRAHGPSLAARDEAHGIVRAAVEESPGLAAVGGDVGPGGAGDDPELVRGQPGDGGTEAFGTGVRRRGPAEAAVGGEGDVLALLLVLGVIAAYGDAMAGVGED